MPLNNSLLNGGADPAIAPASGIEPVVPNDGADFAIIPRALYINVAGDISVIAYANTGNTPEVLKVAAGLLPLRVRRVFATGTTATGIKALY